MITCQIHGHLTDSVKCTWSSCSTGAVIAIQTFGDFLGFNPQCHVLVTDGCFYGRGMFRVALSLEMKKLEATFWHKGFKTLMGSLPEAK
jgi:hypothetical protein